MDYAPQVRQAAERGERARQQRIRERQNHYEQQRRAAAGGRSSNGPTGEAGKLAADADEAVELGGKVGSRLFALVLEAAGMATGMAAPAAKAAKEATEAAGAQERPALTPPAGVEPPVWQYVSHWPEGRLLDAKQKRAACEALEGHGARVRSAPRCSLSTPLLLPDGSDALSMPLFVLWHLFLCRPSPTMPRRPRCVGLPAVCSWAARRGG